MAVMPWLAVSRQLDMMDWFARGHLRVQVPRLDCFVSRLGRALFFLAVSSSVACGGDEPDDSTDSQTVGLTTAQTTDATTTGAESSDGSSSDPDTGSSTATSASTTGDPATTGPGETTDGGGFDGEPGEFVLEYDGRPYRLYVPSGYDAATPIPTLIGFHGAGDSGSNFYNVSKALGLTQAAEPDVFVLIVPDSKSPYSDFANWSGNPQNDIDEMLAEMNDVLALVDDVGSHYHLDPTQVHAFGFSNGGLFTAITGLENSDVLASLTILGYGWGGSYLTGPPARKLGVQFACGQGDSFYGYATQAEAYLSSQGHDTRLITANGVGHDYIGILEAMPPDDMFAWMQAHPLP